MKYFFALFAIVIAASPAEASWLRGLFKAGVKSIPKESSSTASSSDPLADAKTDCARMKTKFRIYWRQSKRADRLSKKALLAFDSKYPNNHKLPKEESHKLWFDMKEVKEWQSEEAKSQELDRQYMQAQMRVFRHLGYSQSEVQEFYDWSPQGRKFQDAVKRGVPRSEWKNKSFPLSEDSNFCKELGIDINDI